MESQGYSFKFGGPFCRKVLEGADGCVLASTGLASSDTEPLNPQAHESTQARAPSMSETADGADG